MLLLGHSWALLGRFWVLLGHSGAFPGPPDLEGSCPSPDPPSPRRCHVPDRRERSGQIKSGHPRPGGDKSPIDVRGQAKSNQVRSGHFVTSPRGDKSPTLWDVFPRQVRSGQVKSGQVRSGEVKSGQVALGVTIPGRRGTFSFYSLRGTCHPCTLVTSPPLGVLSLGTFRCSGPPSGAFLGHSWPLLGCLWVLLAPPWGVLGALWGALGMPLGALGALQGALGMPLGALGTPWGVLGAL